MAVRFVQLMHVERFLICVMAIKDNLLPTLFESYGCKSAIYNGSKCVDEENDCMKGSKQVCSV